MTTQQDHALQVFMGEYSALRQEIVSRIDLQNGLVQRSLYLTGLAGSALAAAFGFMDPPIGCSIDHQEWMPLLSVSAAVVLVYGLLVLLLLANWIYQVAAMFKCVLYSAWLARNGVAPIVGSEYEQFIFRHSRAAPENAPWKLYGLGRLVQLLQVAVMAFLSVLGPMTLSGIAVWAALIPDGIWLTRLGAVGAIVLVAGFAVAAIMHKWVHDNLQRKQRELE